MLFTAVNSPTGGSAKLFALSQLKLTTSQLVLTEVERNVRGKLQSYHLERFLTLVSRLEVRQTTIDERAIGEARRVIVQKDATILAEAKKARADYLVTLDRKDFFNEKVRKFAAPGKIVTPGQLIALIEGK